MDNIGDRLRHFREAEVRLTRGQFIDGLGITARTLERYENGESAPDAAFLTRLNAKYQGTINLDWILTGRGSLYLQPGANAANAPAFKDVSEHDDPVLARMLGQMERIYWEKNFAKLAAIQSLLNLADPGADPGAHPGAGAGKGSQ